MKRLLFTFIFVLGLATSYGQDYTLTNDSYTVLVDATSGKIKVVNLSNNTDTIAFTPTFHVLVSSNAPTPSRSAITEDINYSITSWSGNTDLYSAGSSRIRSAQSVTQNGDQIDFTYTTNSEFSLVASLTLPSGSEYPHLSYCLTASQSMDFSIGYIGAPKYDPAVLDELWQPLVWTERKFPQGSYLTTSNQCTLPATMVTANGLTSGVIVDPDDMPFAPFPTFARSEFGVALRNHEDLAQTMVWAPIMGRGASQLSNGESFCFDLRLFSGDQSIQDFYEELSNDLYGFGNYDRSNVLGSLNETFENMVDYGMSEYSRFIEENKGPSYQTDVPGAVKVTSSLNPLNIAFVTDNEDVFWDRGMPMMEFMLSRNYTTYADEPTSGTGQNAYNELGSACMNISEMTAIYSISKNNMPFLMDMAVDNQLSYADQAYERQWRQHIAFYRATGDEQYLNSAKSAADTYIADRIDGFQDDFDYLHHTKNSFWIQLAPKFVDLMELYEVSGDTKYLNAARVAARRFAMFTWMSAKVPDANITVNEGGQAPVYSYVGGNPISVPEESVPAWRLAEYGLHCEAAATANSHRSIFMAHHAPYFLKIAQLTGDEFLGKIAKSAIVGRYTNFPGYHMNTDYTTVYEKPDFPLRSHEAISSTSMHYNHVWPMMSLILDYLVSDVVTKSDEAVYFKPEFIEAYANLQNRIYGHHPGQFYHMDSVTLWMPKDLLEIGDQELNYIAARKGDTLMLAFTNQSSNAVNTTVSINPELVGFSGTHHMETISNSGSTVPSTISSNTLSLSVAANGITAVIIRDVAIDPAFQDRFYTEQDTTWAKDQLTDSFAGINAMYLNFGPDLSEVYIYSSSPKGTFENVTLTYIINGDTVVVPDVEYPFEYEIPLPEGAEIFDFIVETETSEGDKDTSQVFTLSEMLLASASISGDHFISQGDSVDISVQLEGTAPWSLSYEDGNGSYTIHDILENPYLLNVKPTETATYSITAVSDSTGVGRPHGTVQVTVLEDKKEPIFDGFLRKVQGDGVFTANYVEIKKSEVYAREAIFTFDISDLPRAVDQAAFKLYAYQGDKDFDVSLRLLGIDRGFNNNLTWDTRPSDNEFSSVGSDVQLSHREVPSYVYWNVTAFINQSIEDSVSRVSFKASISEGNDVLLNAYASEYQSYMPQLVFTVADSVMTDPDDTTGVLGSISNSANAFLVYPNPASGQITLISEAEVQVVELLDLAGNRLKSKSGSFRKVNFSTSELSSGIYIMRIHHENTVHQRKVLINGKR